MSFPPIFSIFFEPAKLQEKILARAPRKTSGQRTDGITIFIEDLYFPPPLTSPFVQQYHSLYKGIGIFSRRYGITLVGGDAVALAKLE